MANAVTVKDVRDAVMIKIDSFKDSDVRIYGEEIEQGFKEPCFFIDVLSSNHALQLNDRYKRDHLVDVVYFPNKNTPAPNAEMLNMAETLYSNLEFIQVAGRLLSGLDMRHEVRDGILHFFVRYTLHVKKEREALESMGYLYDDKGVLLVGEETESSDKTN